MNRDLTMRWALAIGALIKFLAVAIVRFPESIGRTADLPPPGSKLYSWPLALFIALFGAVFAWLARRPPIDRPWATVAVVGTFGVFRVALACRQSGEIASKAFGPAIGDSMFGFVFLW
jgi:hypothetical protein